MARQNKPLNTGDVLAKFNQLSWKNQANVLYEAIDFMQQYNGRSRADCICLAMGYTPSQEHDEMWIQEQI